MCLYFLGGGGYGLDQLFLDGRFERQVINCVFDTRGTCTKYTGDSHLRPHPRDTSRVFCILFQCPVQPIVWVEGREFTLILSCCNSIKLFLIILVRSLGTSSSFDRALI